MKIFEKNGIVQNSGSDNRNSRNNLKKSSISAVFRARSKNIMFTCPRNHRKNLQIDSHNRVCSKVLQIFLNNSSIVRLISEKTTQVDADGQTYLDDRLLNETLQTDLKIFRRNRNFPFSGSENRKLRDISIKTVYFYCIQCEKHKYSVYLSKKSLEKSPDRLSQSRFEQNFIDFLE